MYPISTLNSQNTHPKLTFRYGKLSPQMPEKQTEREAFQHVFKKPEIRHIWLDGPFANDRSIVTFPIL